MGWPPGQTLPRNGIGILLNAGGSRSCLNGAAPSRVVPGELSFGVLALSPKVLGSWCRPPKRSQCCPQIVPKSFGVLMLSPKVLGPGVAQKSFGVLALSLEFVGFQHCPQKFWGPGVVPRRGPDVVPRSFGVQVLSPGCPQRWRGHTGTQSPPRTVPTQLALG
ncbi:hypothetical protein DV515_00018809 [Chloebia gouldiae]|uniref:Uncharacterized protein n=1 Tax=Chloebia gouldiae TaxID=44316 RepID=A0A3L8Q6T1_CHLGU|nr:hypothetical protein DV515_00018812 [Chloebia gouldiae]RLV62919.1 hypothetical protein DV515_00018809 [Chloebia gouldiae]